MSTNKTTVDEKKAALLAGLRQVRAEILAASRQLHPGEETITFLGTWALLDLLAHLAGWDDANRLAAQEVLAGKIPSFYNHHSKDWTDFNALLVGEYRLNNLPDMLDVVERTHRGLMDYLEKLPAKELFADHGVRVRGYRVIISRLLEAECKDETVHLGQIIGFLNTRR